MNLKTKIALHSVMQKISRGIITKEQADAEFKKLTGQELDELVNDADEEMGKFLAFLETGYPEPQADPQAEEQDNEPESDSPTEPTDAPAVPVDHPKRTRKPAPPKESK